MQPETIHSLIKKGIVKQRVFDFTIKEFFKPYEKLMMSDRPIHQHLTTLYFIVKEFGLKEVLELGTQEGNSTVSMGLAVKENGGHLTSIDIVRVPIAKQRMEDYNLKDIWTLHENTNDLDMKWDKKIDCLFIDTLHTREQLEAEIKKFAPFVRKGGFVIFHDICANYQGILEPAIIEYFGTKNYYRWFNDCGLGVVKIEK